MRKVYGANRTWLVFQFLGESALVVLLACAVALALSEVLVPSVNALLDMRADIDWRNPSLIILLVLAGLLLALLAGAYPAFVLSAFRPVAALKGANAGPSGGHVRNILVALQFAILIMLIVTSWVSYRQYGFATRDALRVNIDQMLIVTMPPGARCNSAFKTEVRQLRGVRGAFCSGDEFINGPMRHLNPKTGSYIDAAHIDWGLLKLYGVNAVAGSLPDTPFGDSNPDAPNITVINEMAVKRLGFTSVAAAIGQTAPPEGRSLIGKDNRIVAVIPDFALYAASMYPDGPQAKVGPTVYWGMTNLGPFADIMHIKLNGEQIPETLTAIDRLWTQTGGQGQINRVFLDQRFQKNYSAVLRQAQLFALCAGLAAFLACLGLLGLSSAIVERRVKEIGVRKAMGAGNAEIVKLLLWQFVKPILWATLLAWPVAYYAMNRWLTGFPYHIDPNFWPFVAATAMAIFAALLTVIVQSIRTARAVPATALRYE